MSEAKLPKLFQDAMDALDAAQAVDYSKHPRIYRRRWAALQEARQEMAKEYPQLVACLFSYPYRENAARRTELLRLIAEAQKEASDEPCDTKPMSLLPS